ncbi:hypothetical protein ACM66B_005700 [Microbotryomycetes sp. NB124-2]
MPHDEELNSNVLLSAAQTIDGEAHARLSRRQLLVGLRSAPVASKPASSPLQDVTTDSMLAAHSRAALDLGQPERTLQHSPQSPALAESAQASGYIIHTDAVFLEQARTNPLVASALARRKRQSFQTNPFPSTGFPLSFPEYERTLPDQLDRFASRRSCSDQPVLQTNNLSSSPTESGSPAAQTTLTQMPLLSPRQTMLRPTASTHQYSPSPRLGTTSGTATAIRQPRGPGADSSGAWSARTRKHAVKALRDSAAERFAFMSGPAVIGLGVGIDQDAAS